MSKLLLGIVREGQRFIRVLRPLIMAMLLVNVLAGCGSDHSADGNSFLFSANAPSLLLHGSVLGGRQPIVGSSVLIMAASKTAATAWTQIAAATTDRAGNFAIQSFSTPPSDGDLIYAVSVGGDAGGGTNNNAVLLSMFGTYSASTQTVSSTIAIINEATTVAMLETFAGNLELISRCAVSSGVVSCPSSWSGVANTPITYPTATAGSIPINLPRPQQLGGGDWSSAVTTFNHYVNASTDGQPSSNLSDNTLQTVNMMASVLANCVNSSGGVAGDTSACGNLFSLATENPSNTNLNTVTTTKTIGAAYFYAQLYAVAYTGYSVPSVPGTVVSMVTSPSGQFLYVLYKDINGGNHLSAFNFDNSTGQISAMNNAGSGSASVSTAAGTALSLAISPDGQTLYAANSDVGAKVSAVSINSDGSLNPNIVVTTLTNPTTANAVSLSPDGTGLAVVYQTTACSTTVTNGTDACDHMSYWSVAGTAITQPSFWANAQGLGINTAGSTTTSVWLPNRQKFSGYTLNSWGSQYVFLSAEQAAITGSSTGTSWFVFPSIPTSGSFNCVVQTSSGCLAPTTDLAGSYLQRTLPAPGGVDVSAYLSVGGGSTGYFINGISKILPADNGTTNFVMAGKNHSWSFSYNQTLVYPNQFPNDTGPAFVGAALGSFGGSPAAQGFALTKGSQYLYHLGGTATSANIWHFDLTTAASAGNNLSLGYALAGPNVLTPNGRFLIAADSSANAGLRVFFSSRSVPTDTIAAMFSLITAANRRTTANNGAAALFSIAPANPVYGTSPSQAPASLLVQ